MSDKPELRDAMEIQRAHDTLVNVLKGQIDIGPIEGNEQLALHVALDVLCWALKHDDNKSFEANLIGIRQLIAEAGYTEHEAPAPFTLADLDEGKAN